MQLSGPNQELIRTQPQQSELFLSIFQPTTALACMVSGTVSKNSITIPYKNVSSGSYLAVEPGMTLLVGSSAGGRELGKIRVRSITSSAITVSENSNINWPLATHLTVLRYWEVWPVYPRIISDPNNIDNVIFYKDYDTAYTNQNTILGTFPCAGSHLAGWAGDSFYFSNTGTLNLAGVALTHDWAFEGATVTGSTSATPGSITWNTPGHYVVRYKVTGANGSVDTTYRYVSIYNRPENSSSNIPILKWNIDTVSGGRDEGGYSSTIAIKEENITINEGDVVVLFSENWYGTQKVNLGGNSQNPSIFFSGHILNNSIRFDYKSKTTEFEVGSITSLMQTMEGFSVSVESKVNPSTWFELLDMDGRRALYHYLRWHTTVLYLADFQFIGTDQKIQFFDSDRQSIYDAVDNYMRGTLEGKVTADIQGKIWAEVGAWATPNPTGSFPTQFSITKRDWVGSPNIIERLIQPVSYLERGGVAYSGAFTGTFSAIISSAPGTAPGFRGNEDKQEGMALFDQAQLNILTGNLFANKNSKYPEISSMNMNGNYRNLDIAPQMAVAQDIDPSDNNRGISLHAPYLVDKISWRYDSKNKVLRCEISYISLVNGDAGETITIPAVQTISNNGFNIPNFRLPSINPLIPSLGTGMRFWFGQYRRIYSQMSDGNQTYDMIGDSTRTTTQGDASLFAGSSGGTITSTGLYLLIATLRITLNQTSSKLTFTAPAGNSQLGTLEQVAGENQYAGGITALAKGVPFTRLVYYQAGQPIQISASYTGGAHDPDPGAQSLENMHLDVYLLKLT